MTMHEGIFFFSAEFGLRRWTEIRMKRGQRDSYKDKYKHEEMLP